MSFVTFFYQIGENIFYGKYCADWISDDHEGLDEVVRPYLLKGLNEFRKQKDLTPIRSRNVRIGVIGFSEGSHAGSFSTKKERKSFDFYCETEHFVEKYFVNGKKIVFADDADDKKKNSTQM